MSGTVWFGTKANMQWVPAPAINMGAGKTGFAARADFANGGSWVRRSKASAKTYNMAWNLEHREDIQPILDYADGIYGDGDVYFLDPFATDRNVLPSYWAAPFINGYDGPAIVDGIRPTLHDHGSAVDGYPAESGVYKLTSTMRAPSVYIPIPPNSVAHIGAHGQVLAGNATVTVMSHATTAGGPTANLTLLPRAAGARTNMTVAGSAYSGITISLKSTSTGTIRLDGLIVQVLPVGRTVPSGGFISGQGSSGLSFVTQPSVTAYSAALDRVGVSAELVETEAWSWR